MNGKILHLSNPAYFLFPTSLVYMRLWATLRCWCTYGPRWTLGWCSWDLGPCWITVSFWLMEGLESVTQALHTYRTNSNKRYLLTLVWMAINKKSTNNKFWRGCGEKGMLLHSLWECKLIQPLWKIVWRFLKKLGIKPPYDPVIPLLGMYPEETKIETYTCIPVFIAALFTIARTWKQPRCPLTDKVAVHIHNGILLSHTKEHIWVSSDEVDEPRTYCTEWSES